MNETIVAKAAKVVTMKKTSSQVTSIEHNVVILSASQAVRGMIQDLSMPCQ
jgi:hypothetical protein